MEINGDILAISFLSRNSPNILCQNFNAHNKQLIFVREKFELYRQQRSAASRHSPNTAHKSKGEHVENLAHSQTHISLRTNSHTDKFVEGSINISFTCAGRCRPSFCGAARLIRSSVVATSVECTKLPPAKVFWCVYEGSRTYSMCVVWFNTRLKKEVQIFEQCLLHVSE